jgi:hypothetical protein
MCQMASRIEFFEILRANFCMKKVKLIMLKHIFKMASELHSSINHTLTQRKLISGLKMN